MVVSRFAPSPTGDLHIGGVRTALYAWLYARQAKGKFILRIEDTDTERSTKASVDGILAGMAWLGMDYDIGPIFQSDRYDRYKQVADQLLHSGHVYKCYCTKERLDKVREEQQLNNLKPKYDGFCRFHPENLHTDDESYVLRFATPKSGEAIYTDRIRGDLKVNNEELDDLVIMRSNGVPTYNFAVVVDDLDMEVSMVIRGDDHINNTFRQINIFRALDVKPPLFAHVSAILGSDSKKLSKRHGAASVLAYRDEGILPQALLNALVRLGWSHGDKEIFSLEQMIELFKIDDVHKSPAVFDPVKLNWFNQHYLKTLDNNIIAEHLRPFLDSQNIDYKSDSQNKPELLKVVEVLKSRAKNLKELAEKSACFYLSEISYDPTAEEKFFTQKAIEVLSTVASDCTAVDQSQWTTETLHEVLSDIQQRLNLKMPDLAQPIRLALTGNTNSPPINETMVLLSRPIVLARLASALEYLNKKFS